MTDPGIAQQLSHISSAKGFTHTSPLFVHMEGVIVHRDNPCRVLTTVLKQKQIVVDLLVD